MLARVVVALLLLVAANAPLVAAMTPSVPDPTSDVVTGHDAYDSVASKFCSSYPGFASVASTDLTSRITTAPAGGGVTTFTVHLDATLPDPVDGGVACDAIDLTFTSAVAWPPTQHQEYASFSSPCGLAGTIQVYSYGPSQSIQLVFSDAPTSCALPVQTGVIDWTSTAAHPSTAVVCTPLVVAACAGAYTESYPYYGCNGGSIERLYVAAVFNVAFIERGCNYQDGREHVTVEDGVGLVAVDTTSDSCNVLVNDPFGITGQTASTPCPEEVRSVVYNTDWTHLLP